VDLVPAPVAVLALSRGGVNLCVDELQGAVVGRLLRGQDLTLAVAESCTGGLVGHLITDIPGSSVYFLGSVVAYSYAAKESILNVPHAMLVEHGAVSEEVAACMASGVRNVLSADVGLSVTGIAGPDGGSPDKPVGLVYVGLSTSVYQRVRRFVWGGNRGENKLLSAQAALGMLCSYLESRSVVVER
jgi:PncC family amidohydrolase